MEKRILIVDDEVNILSESKKLVQDHGAVIDIAESMGEAITLLNIREYEFVIVGVRSVSLMGEREFEVLKTMQQNKATMGVILLTGYGDPKGTEEALSIGAAYYYEKRVSAKVLREALGRFAKC